MSGFIMVGGNLYAAAHIGWAYRLGVRDERAGYDHTENPFCPWEEPEEFEAWDAGWWWSWGWA
jgi:hypothetical protein